MKTINSVKYVLAGLSLLMGMGSCGNNLDFDYVPPLTIEFSTESIVQIAQGETSYTITGKVKSETGVLEYVAFDADARTGNIKTEIDGTRMKFEAGKQKEYPFSVTVDNIESNRAVKILAIDEAGSYTKGFVVKITPSVIFTDMQTVESGDYYYGSYFATWHLGRVYPLRKAKDYPEAVDISFAEIRDPLTGITAPVVISPAQREKHGLDSYEGAKETRFSLTDMTMKEYNAIKEVDDAPLKSLVAADEYVVVSSGKVYAYETAEGKKGLLAVHSVAAGSHVYTFKVSAKVQQ